MQQHVDRILEVASGAIPLRGTHQTDSGLLIERSWFRCVNEYGLDPSKPRRGRIETRQRLRESREQIEEYMLVARAGMEQLFKRVRALGYVLLLTDAQGITVDYIGNDSWDRELRNAGLALGANWQESHAGTNGIGTCIAEQAALTCHRDDHFFSSHLGLSCTTTPLFGPEGDFIGALDVSALSSPEAKESQHLALHLTLLYGQMIEDANFLRHFRDRWILRLGTAGPLVDVCGELMLAFDKDGVVVGANPAARRELCGLAIATQGKPQRDTIVGRALDELLRCRLDDIWKLARSAHLDEQTLITATNHQVYQASLIVPRVPGPTAVARIEPANDALSAKQDFAALDKLAGEDRHMGRVLDHARRLVDKQVSILVQGETGTGKEVFARALHACSQRKDMPFVAVNCASIPETLIESELFGYTPGTFTGARSRGMKGLIQQSDGGTLFLDEIGDMPLQLQTRLLRVLSEREVLPLGAERPVKVALTVIAASHRDLRKQIAAGTFREDLYYRLCGATLSLPPLRERGDKLYIIDRILREEAEHLAAMTAISPAAIDRLLEYDWPGNVRQLRNVIRFALAISDGLGIGEEHLPPELGEPAPSIASIEIKAQPAANVSANASEAERELLATLQRLRWNISAVASEMGVSRTTIYHLMRRHNIVSPKDRDLQA
ncbi:MULTISPECIES: sigma-54-dependent Fis family transcriptional regulator [Hydrocarboniphaga]|jgi:transcriptional regulator of acetoin/glycerol metabolism|uniref:Transcriptional regulator AcoR n=1 Tax=Hydrocarboniphaga effusa AP103 TaxID=1172194 RepID=I8TCN0_9GAMM|nr:MULTISPECIES: sigma-54-dependent Fis family transcriptional regulator [Hydrocarboniphaga]EIT71428.1 transcriptional regulator AcoR [Hydrocarboniphaga effusa AP103]MDZ4079339.1 sigma-54-dependent Fis family transcriptional regulator [Hydrocarboniphaga sp.]